MKKWKSCLNRNSTIIVLFILLLGFSGCDLFFVDTSIRPEKPPLFRMGDTLIFKSTVNVDSFYVEGARLYEVNEDDGSGVEWDKERFFSRLIQIDCLDSCYSLGSTIIPGEYWIVVFGYEYFSYELVEYDKRFADLTRQIGSYKLKELYGSYNLDTDSVNGKEINYILYSKKYGVIEYRLTKGEVFQIEEECLTMLMARE